MRSRFAMHIEGTGLKLWKTVAAPRVDFTPHLAVSVATRLIYPILQCKTMERVGARGRDTSRYRTVVAGAYSRTWLSLSSCARRSA